MLVVKVIKYGFSDLKRKNLEFLKRMKAHQKEFNLHEKTMNIKPEETDRFIKSQPVKKLA
jgi:hypothetical protein